MKPPLVDDIEQGNESLANNVMVFDHENADSFIC